MFRIGYIGRGGALVGLTYGVMPRSKVLSAWEGMMGDRRALYAMVENWTPTRYDSRYNIERGTYASLDGGYSWEYVFTSDCGSTVAVRPGNPKEVWIFGESSACMLKAAANGREWQHARGARFRARNDRVNKIAFDPHAQNVLYYAAGVNENRVYRYRYDANGDGEATELSVGAADLVVCEDNPSALYAGIGQLSTDGGWTWTDKSAALSDYVDLRGSKEYRRRDFTLLSCRGSELRAAVHRYDSYLHSGGFWIIGSKDLGDTWEVLASFPDQQMMGIFADPDDSTNMFAVAQRFAKSGYVTKGDSIEVLETRDWGSTWRKLFSHKLRPEDEHHEDECVTSVREAAAGSGHSILVGGRIGLWKSDDGGKSWIRLGGAR